VQQVLELKLKPRIYIAAHICIPDSEKASSTLYSCLIVTIHFSCMFPIYSSLLLAGNDVKAFSPLGVLQLIYIFGY